MKFCENCGAKLQDDEKFCSECGAKLEVNNVERNAVDNNKTKTSSSAKIVLIVFAIVIVLGLIGVGIYLFFFNNSESKDDSSVNTTSNATANTTSNTTTEANTTSSGNALEYLLPDSDKRIITDGELSNLTAEEVRLACNELYARHGRKFSDSSIQAYFNSKSWYHGTIEPNAFDEAVFNEYERKNKDTIVNYEKFIGSNQNSNSGGYSNQQLIDMARRYANSKGSNPPNVEIDGESGDNVTIHLYSNGADSTYTYDWYTVNRKTGEGTNNMGERIKLQ